ncbi:MAG TPA: DUF3040 domain-containing protein [Phycicoccus sp.]|nr:DUF3040 domain-containing protein [Phycicoccus sp.]
MPLSEHEQQLLAQMEQALASEDPRFAHQMRGGAVLAVRRRRLVIGLIGVIVGLALVVVGVNTTMWIGALGFALMVATVAYAATPVRSDAAAKAKRGGPTGGKGSRKDGPGFMDKLDERWERRERGL